MQYNMTDPMKDNIVIPSILFNYYPEFYVPNYTEGDFNIIRKYLLYCTLVYYVGLLINKPVIATTYYKYTLTYNIVYRYIYSFDSYTSVKNIITAMFIFDLFEKLFSKAIYERKSYKFTDFVITYHHIVILFVFVTEPMTDFTCGIVYGEIGNIPLNIEYCMLKYKDEIFPRDLILKEKIFKLVKHINIIVYTIVRIGFFTYFILFLDYTCYSTYYTFIPLYIMGLVWSRTLFKQWKKTRVINNIVD